MQETDYPTTPGGIARAALDRIAANPDAFDMAVWASFDERMAGENHLPPDRHPGCGTTLCAAGWVCHVAGLTLQEIEGGGWICAVAPDGTEGDIEMEANRLLRVYHGPWYRDKHTALAFLQEIADSETDS